MPGPCPQLHQGPRLGVHAAALLREPAAAWERLSLICAGRVKPFQEWFGASTPTPPFNQKYLAASPFGPPVLLNAGQGPIALVAFSTFL